MNGPANLPPQPPPFPSNDLTKGMEVPKGPLPVPPSAPGGSPAAPTSAKVMPEVLKDPGSAPTEKGKDTTKPSAGLPGKKEVGEDLQKEKGLRGFGKMLSDNKTLFAGIGIAAVGVLLVVAFIPGPHTLLLLGAIAMVAVGIGVIALSPFLEKPVDKGVDYGVEKIKKGVAETWEHAKPAAEEIKESAKKAARKGVEVAKTAVHSVQVQKFRTAMADFLTDTVAGTVAPSLNLDPTDKRAADKGDDVKEESLLDSLKAEAKKAVKEGETTIKDFGEGVNKTVDHFSGIAKTAIESVKIGDKVRQFKTSAARILEKAAGKAMDSSLDLSKKTNDIKTNLNDLKT